MADGQIVRFSIGEAFPADNQLSRWMTVCAMALNDLLAVNRLLVPRLEEKIPAQKGENYYLACLAAGHLFEAATFLRRSDRISRIHDFVQGLDEEARQAYADLLEIGDGGRGEFFEQLKNARNRAFHYQQLFLGDHEEREPLKRAMSAHADDELERGIKRGEIRDVPPALTGFIATFAYDIATEMLLPGDADQEYPGFISNTANHIAKFMAFTKAALNSYTQTTKPEIWDVEDVDENAGFVELLGALQERVGKDVSGQLTVDGRFFGLSFQARLERVETLPKSEAIRVVFSNDLAVDLAPGEQVLSPDGESLELELTNGVGLSLDLGASDAEPEGPSEG